MDRSSHGRGTVPPLSKLLAHLASAPLSVSLLIEHRGVLPAELADCVASDEASLLEALGDHGPVAPRLEGNSVVLSQYPASEIRRQLAQADRETWSLAALRLLGEALPPYPDDFPNWTLCEPLVPHIRAATRFAKELELHETTAVSLLCGAGTYLLSRGRLREAKELIEQAMDLANRAPVDEMLAASLHAAFGDVCAVLGDDDSARREFEAALSLYRDGLPDGGREVGEVRIGLADVLVELGELDDARDQIDLAAAEAEESESGRFRCRVGLMRSWALFKAGELDDARVEYQRIVALGEELMGPEDPTSAATHGGYGFMLLELGETEEAKAEIEQALRVYETTTGGDHPNVAVNLSNLSGANEKLGEFGAAREQLERALEIGEATLPKNHRGLWIRHRKLASVLVPQGEYALAREHAEKALAITEVARRDGPKLAGDLSVLAGILSALDETEEALATYRRALAVGEESFDADHPEVPRYALALGRALQGTGNLAEAATTLADAVAKFDRGDAMESTDAARARISLAEVMVKLVDAAAIAHTALGGEDHGEKMRDGGKEVFLAVTESTLQGGDVEAAIAVADACAMRAPDRAVTALETAQEHVGDDRRRQMAVASGWHRLGSACRERDEGKPAIHAYESAVLLLEDYPEMQGIVLDDLGYLLLRLRRFDEAIGAYQRAIERRRLVSGIDPKEGARSLLGLGWALEGADRLEDALQAYEDQLAVLEGIAERDPEAEGITLHHLASVRLKLDNPSVALDLYRKAANRKREGGKYPTDLTITLAALGRTLMRCERYEEASGVYREQLEVLESLPERNLNAEGVTLHYLGDLERMADRLKDAATFYRKAAERKREGGKKPTDLAFTLLTLASVELKLAPPESEPGARTAAEAVELFRADPDSDPYLLASALVLSASAQSTENPEAAIATFEEADRLLGSASSPNPTEVAALKMFMADAFSDLGREEEAAAARDAARHVLAVVLKGEPAVVDPGELHSICRLCLNVEAYELAEEVVERIRALPEGDDGSRDLMLRDVLRELARAHELQSKNYDAAKRFYEERLALLTTLPKREAAAEGETLRDLGDVSVAQEQHELAVDFYNRAIERMRAAPDSWPPRKVAKVVIALGRAHLALKEHERACDLGDEAVAILEHEPRPSTLAAALSLRARALIASGAPKKALTAIEKAERELIADSDGHPKERAELKEVSADAYESLGKDAEAAAAREQATELDHGPS